MGISLTRALAVAVIVSALLTGCAQVTAPDYASQKDLAVEFTSKLYTADNLEQLRNNINSIRGDTTQSVYSKRLNIDDLAVLNEYFVPYNNAKISVTINDTVAESAASKTVKVMLSATAKYTYSSGAVSRAPLDITYYISGAKITRMVINTLPKEDIY